MEKRLLNIQELCEYTGWGKTKVREILKRPDSTFTIKMVLSSIVSKSMLGIMCGSMLENIEFVMESLILKISPDSPHTSNESCFS